MIKNIKTIIMLFTVLWLCRSTGFAAAGESPYPLVYDEQFVESICSDKVKDKNYAVDLLIKNSADNYPIIEQIINANAYCLPEAKELIFRQDGKYFKYNGQSIDIADSDAKRINISSSKKRQLKKTASQFYLFSDDDSKRLQAVSGILKGNNELPGIDTVDALILKENNREIYEALKVVRANSIAKDPEAGVQELLQTIDILQDHGQYLDVLTLQELAENKNEVIAGAARSAVTHIENAKTAASFIQNLFFGLSLGSVLVLSAIGLSITFGVMGVINMAHGEFMMIGAYCVYVLQSLMPDSPGIALMLSIPAAFIVCGLLGIAVERSVIRFLYGRPLETLLATFGLSLFMQQLVRTIFSPLNKPIVTPEFLQGSIMIGSYLEITVNRLFIVGYCILCFLVILFIIKQSRLGLEVRAVSQNRSIARALGIEASRVDALTFGLGSAVAGLSGVALSQITNVGPNLGQNYIIDSFMVVVFGGVGSLWGTLSGGLILGIANKLLEPISGAMLSKIIILMIIIVFIQKRPSGLFPQKGRAVED